MDKAKGVSNRKRYFFYFTDSIGQSHQLYFQLGDYHNLMEFIRDQGYEDWGDCRGRAWCATCHISSPSSIKKENHPISGEEQKRLNQLSNCFDRSRLACQIPLDKSIHGKEFKFIGDD